jgi:hypothetical protein
MHVLEHQRAKMSSSRPADRPVVLYLSGKFRLGLVLFRACYMLKGKIEVLHLEKKADGRLDIFFGFYFHKG